MRIVNFDDFQFVDTSDLQNIGLYGRAAHDALVALGVGRGKGWDGFNVVIDSTTSVNVTTGVIAYEGALYGLADLPVTPVDLLPASPTNSKVIVAIVATGAEVKTGAQSRSFEIEQQNGEETTRQAISRSHFTEIRRKLSITHIIGAEAGVPQRPVLLPNYVPIAWVTMQVGAGIVGVEMATEFQVKSLQALEARLLKAEATLELAGSQIETLGTTVANTQKSIAKLPVPALLQGLRSITEVRQLLGRNNDGLLSGFEFFMDDAGTNTGAVGFKARVEEGLRFPWAATATIPPQLLNPSSPRVMTNGGWLLPAYEKVRRLEIWRQDTSISIADYNYSNTSATIYPGSRSRRRSGPSMIVSENSQFWNDVKYNVNYLLSIFKKGTEEWSITDSWVEDGVTFYRVEQYFSDKIPYWNGYRSLTDAVSGMLAAQTFLNAQPGWLIGMGLRFSKVSDEDLKLYITGVKEGKPSFAETYAQGTLSGAASQASVAGTAGVENEVVLQPLFLPPGEYFAAQFVSAGDYAIACRGDNYLTNGALFNGDGQAYVADLGKDANMRQYFAKFNSNYVEVELQSLTLSEGITDIDFLSTEHVPPGTELHFEYQVGGIWYAADKIKGAHPLNAKPPTVPARLVFVGTRDAMPGINLADSEIRLYRADDDFVWESATKNCGTNASEVTLEVEIANWDGAKHALATTVKAGAGTYSAAATSDEVLPNGNLRRTMTFTLTVPSSTFSIRMVGTTTDVVDGFVVSSIYYLASN